MNKKVAAFYVLKFIYAVPIGVFVCREAVRWMPVLRPGHRRLELPEFLRAFFPPLARGEKRGRSWTCGTSLSTTARP